MPDEISVRSQRRAAILDPVCDHLLAHGLDAANLRALARAAGTSDRMLLYYFDDKNDLIREALKRLADRLAAKLTERTPDGPMPPDRLANAVWAVVQEPEFWPYMVLFVEIVARSARTGEPYSFAAKAITNLFLEWLSRRLDATEDAVRSAQAHEVLATVDGRALLRMAQET